MKYVFRSLLGRQPESIREFFDLSATLFADKPALMQKVGEEYENYSYKQFKNDVDALGTELLARDLGGKSIIVMGENCYAWALVYMTAVCGIGTVVPLDKDIEEAELCQAVEKSGAAAIFCSRSRFETASKQKGVEVFPFDQLDALTESGREKLLGGDGRYLIREAAKDEPAVLLFNSDVTRGVLLSNANICSSLYQMSALVDINESDLFLSVLPLHHSYECFGGFLAPIFHGATVAFCEGLGSLVKNMKEVHPTVLVCVPSLVEAIYKKISATVSARKLDTQTGAAVALVGLLDKLGKKFSAPLQKKMFEEIHASLGGRLRLIISSGASVSPKSLDGLRGFGINAIQCYGLAECGGFVAINPTSAPKSRSAGLPLPLGTVDIYDAQADGVGEIRYKGENVMLGYLNDPKLTDESLRSGWFYTEDMGYLDKNGYLFITGRKSNVIRNGAGKSIFPEELETYLGRSRFVKESVVMGVINEEKNDCDIVAVIHPNYDAFSQVYGDGYTVATVEKELASAVEYANSVVDSHKHIERFEIKESPFKRNSAGKIKRAIKL